MKTSNAIVLFILVFILIFGLFLLLKNTNPSVPATLGQGLDCTSLKLDQSILELDNDTDLLRAFISFNNLPLSTEIEQRLADLNVLMDENSLIFDNIWAIIPVESLCPLVAEEEIKSIFTLKQ